MMGFMACEKKFGVPAKTAENNKLLRHFLSYPVKKESEGGKKFLSPLLEIAGI